MTLPFGLSIFYFINKHNNSIYIYNLKIKGSERKQEFLYCFSP